MARHSDPGGGVNRVKLSFSKQARLRKKQGRQGRAKAGIRKAATTNHAHGERVTHGKPRAPSAKKQRILRKRLKLMEKALPAGEAMDVK